MHNQLLVDWSAIQQAYQLNVSVDQVSALSNGLINDTFSLSDLNKDKKTNLILQRINRNIFNRPDQIQSNFDEVSAYLARAQYPFPILQIVPTRTGESLCMVKDSAWRLMLEIEASYTVSQITDCKQAFSAAQIVGHFDKALQDLSVANIHTTINGFHDLALRLNQYHDALNRNVANRRNSCLKEISFVEQFMHLSDWQKKMSDVFKIPQRVTHNDTKISNFMMCSETNLAKALIDWDTIMPGYWLFDYGDMVRSFAPFDNEENHGDSDAEFRIDILQATTEGYLNACGEQLSSFEKENLLMGVQIIVFMLGVRFLTDYLNGDVYFKTNSEAHNLFRCRSQFSLLKQLDTEYKNWQKMLGLLPR